MDPPHLATMDVTRKTTLEQSRASAVLGPIPAERSAEPLPVKTLDPKAFTDIRNTLTKSDFSPKFMARSHELDRSKM